MSKDNAVVIVNFNLMQFYDGEDGYYIVKAFTAVMLTTHGRNDMPTLSKNGSIHSSVLYKT